MATCDRKADALNLASIPKDGLFMHGPEEFSEDSA